jgi:hypothetical protein
MAIGSDRESRLVFLFYGDRVYLAAKRGQQRVLIVSIEQLNFSSKIIVMTNPAHLT